MATAHFSIKNLNMVDFISKFLCSTSPYIPIYNKPFTHHPHQKITFINIVDPQCENAFKFNSYFDNKNV